MAILQSQSHAKSSEWARLRPIARLRSLEQHRLALATASIDLLVVGSMLQLAGGFVSWLPGSWTGLEGTYYPATQGERLFVVQAKYGVEPGDHRIEIPVTADGPWRVDLPSGDYLLWAGCPSNSWDGRSGLSLKPTMAMVLEFLRMVCGSSMSTM